MHFHKFHGTGNDFIMIDNREDHFDDSLNHINSLCNRHTGIGADGLITLQSSEEYDFGMKYYNSDGGEGSMCGNGGRCIVAFADMLGLVKEQKVTFTAIDGLHQAEILQRGSNNWQVSLQMKDVENATVEFMDTGSPHHMENVEDPEKTDVVKMGRKIRYSKAYEHTGGTNVNFFRLKDGIIHIRTYERGVEDETLSCGTGTVAVALSHALSSKLNQGPLHVHSRGGLLSVNFRKKNNNFTDIKLTGPAVKVFEGDMI